MRLRGELWVHAAMAYDVESCSRGSSELLTTVGALPCAGVFMLCFVIVVATNLRLLIENFLK